MAQHRKFLFETEFEAAREGRGKGEEIPTHQHVEQARQQGYEEGRSAGRNEAEAERARLETDALARIAREVGTIAQRNAAGFEQLRQENMALALSIGRKLANRLMATQPLAEIEAVVEESLRRLMGEARIVIRLHESLLDAMQARVDAMIRSTGFAGQVILLAEDDIPPGDCRVEWADGGMTRAAATIESEIDSLIARALGADPTEGEAGS
jgi:flagellar assembly protein FliH